MRHHRVLPTALLLAAAAALAAPVTAQASFHLVSIREVYPGSSGTPDAEYVELQMYAPGQDLVRGHSIGIFDAAGVRTGTATFGANVPSGANQSTLVAATPAAESAFGIVADTGMPTGLLDPAGGAVCWETLDCVSWGSFSGSTPSPSGSPADPLGIPDGMGLRRTIEPNCPTLLEAADDTNDSATDFSNSFPSPRPNSVPPSEHACSAQGPAEGGYPVPGAGGGQAGSNGARRARRRPQTRIRHRPHRHTHDRTPTFRFTSNRRRARFLCRLDRRRFRRCRSPFTARRLRFGRHVFRVKARMPGGATDRSPARWRFRVVPHR